MTPLSAVKVVKKGSPYEGTGGVVEAVKKDKGGDVTSVTVDLDVDHKRVDFKPGELVVLNAH